MQVCMRCHTMWGAWIGQFPALVAAGANTAGYAVSSPELHMDGQNWHSLPDGP